MTSAPDATGPEEADGGAPADGVARRPGLDLTGALHTAGHEIELLHAEGVPDSAPVLHPDEDDPDLGPGGRGHDFFEGFEGDAATRGM